MRYTALIVLLIFILHGCTKSNCASTSAICKDAVIYSKSSANFRHEYIPPSLRVSGGENAYLDGYYLIFNDKKAIYGCFSNILFYNDKKIHETVSEELCFFVGCLSADEKILWIKVIRTGVSYWSLSDLGFAASMGEDGQIVAAFTSTGACQLSDAFSNETIDICVNGVLGVCFDQTGKLLWHYDFGNGWASPYEIKKNDNIISLSVIDSGGFQCGCSGVNGKNFSCLALKYQLPDNRSEGDFGKP